MSRAEGASRHQAVQLSGEWTEGGRARDLAPFRPFSSGVFRHSSCVVFRMLLALSEATHYAQHATHEALRIIP